ncbi:hypothetical protein AAVH_19790 [Aphelenchoides avenae]|nr:hypothetical protein AAVH_19790 [Aphelenchus avenae]
MLVQFLLGKLPNAMKLKLFENRDPATLDANAILKGVRDHLSNLDRARSSGLTFHHGTKENSTTAWSSPPGSFDQQNRTRQNFKPASNNPQFYVANFSTKSCSFCNEGHAAIDCTTYATADDRTKRALELNLCLLCLEGDHGLRLRELLFGRKPAYHETLHRNVMPPSLPVRAPSPFTAGEVDDLSTDGVTGNGLPGSAYFLTNGVLDAISPPIGTVPHVVEQPTATRARSARSEPFNGSSTSETTVSPERTAPGQGGTPRATASSGTRSQNPQGATACGDEERLFTHRQHLSADNGSRTKTALGTSGENLRTGSPVRGNRATGGGRDLRSNEEVLIHNRNEDRHVGYRSLLR